MEMKMSKIVQCERQVFTYLMWWVVSTQFGQGFLKSHFTFDHPAYNFTRYFLINQLVSNSAVGTIEIEKY